MGKVRGASRRLLSYCAGGSVLAFVGVCAVPA